MQRERAKLLWSARIWAAGFITVRGSRLTSASSSLRMEEGVIAYLSALSIGIITVPERRRPAVVLLRMSGKMD
jgi:hypothetical protein